MHMNWQQNQQAYDESILEGPRRVSYTERKGGNNGSLIFTISFNGLQRRAQEVIRNVRQGNPPQPRSRGGARNHKEFQNRAGDLPAGGQYREYSAADPNLPDPGAVIVVHDHVNDNFYITATHYNSFNGGRGRTRDNPFYRIKEIPFEKCADGGRPKTITPADC